MMNFILIFIILISSIQGIFQNYNYDIFITILSMEFLFISINLAILLLFIITSFFNYLGLFIAIICLSSAESAILVTILLQITSTI